MLKAKAKQLGKHDELDDLQTKTLDNRKLELYSCFWIRLELDACRQSMSKIFHARLRIDAAASKSAMLKADAKHCFDLDQT